MEVSLKNQAREVARAHQALDDLAGRHSLPARSVTRLHVAIEEHLTNIISYGYQPGQKGTINVRFAVEPSNLTVEIEDDGRPFNLAQAPEVDTSLPLDERPLGGLGIHMIRKSVDRLEYRRSNGRNMLTLQARISFDPPAGASGGTDT